MSAKLTDSGKRAIKKVFALAGLEIRRAPRARPATSGRHPVRRGSNERMGAEVSHEALDFLRFAKVSEMNRGLQERIRAELATGRPLKVGFIVNDKAKWNADSLIKEMREAGWSTKLYVCLSNARYADSGERARAYGAECDFFSEIDKDLVALYQVDDDSQTPIEDNIDADVVFYQQPWGMLDFPRRLIGRSLGAYMHYGFMLMANHDQHYSIETFHPYLWRYFTQTNEHRLLHLQHDHFAYDKLLVTGYPKLDVYCDQPLSSIEELWPSATQDVGRIIYAPHHALSKGSLGMSTFAWTHKVMLELAKTTPGLQWVYKPHPLLRYKAVQSKVMSREEYSDYEASWSRLPNATVYDSGRYFDLFRSSDALITDCGSFLAEYLPTGMPILWLASATSVGFNVVGQTLSRAFYRIESVAELRETFQRVIMERVDPLVSARRDAARLLFPSGGRAATVIVDHLRRELNP